MNEKLVERIKGFTLGYLEAGLADGLARVLAREVPCLVKEFVELGFERKTEHATSIQVLTELERLEHIKKTIRDIVVDSQNFVSDIEDKQEALKEKLWRAINEGENKKDSEIDPKRLKRLLMKLGYYGTQQEILLDHICKAKDIVKITSNAER